MSAARRRGVGVGDRILAEGVPSVVVSVSGTRVRLADDEGRVQTVTAADLADLRIKPHTFHGEWNYDVRPN